MQGGWASPGGCLNRRRRGVLRPSGDGGRYLIRLVYPPCNRRPRRPSPSTRWPGATRLNLTTTGSADMFFITYLRREVPPRMRQTIFVALGLALGVGLVVTRNSPSAGGGKTQIVPLCFLSRGGTDLPAPGRT